MDNARIPDKDFLEFLVKSIVHYPDNVKVEREVDERGVILKLRVHAEDMGQVVGRQGKTADALRALVRIVGRKHDALVSLKIEEPEGSTHVPKAPPAAPDAAEQGI